MTREDALWDRFTRRVGCQVLNVAYQDLGSDRRYEARKAWKFIISEDCRWWCEMLGYDYRTFVAVCSAKVHETTRATLKRYMRKAA